MSPEQTAQWIWDRCVPCGECLEWKQAMHGSAPICRLPNTKKTAQARRVLMEALGIRILGRLCVTNCRNPKCMARDHVISLTRKQLQARTAKLTGYGPRLSRRANLAQARRKTAVLTLEKVKDMRARGLSSRAAAAEFGVTQSAAHQALSGLTWQDYSNPFMQLGAR